MTDNDIIKALECCGSETTFMTCGDCPLLDVGKPDCHFSNAKKALDLINRQNKEINRLKNELHGKVDHIREQRKAIDDLKKYNKKGLTVEVKFDKEQLEESIQECMRDYELRINEVRNEAIKEFAERLKKKMYPFSYAIGVENAIDDLVKEMTEGV